MQSLETQNGLLKEMESGENVNEDREGHVRSRLNAVASSHHLSSLSARERAIWMRDLFTSA